MVNMSVRLSKLDFSYELEFLYSFEKITMLELGLQENVVLVHPDLPLNYKLN